MQLKTAVVSGAGSGMGRAVAEDLARSGMKVALLGRDKAKLDEVVAGLGAAAGNCLAISCDVGDRPAVAAAAKEAEGAFGSVDVLVCNAGINVPKRTLADLDPADWDRLIETNLTGAFNLVHFVLPGMRSRKNGLVIQVCSISGLRASPLGGVAYAASKYGQSGLGWYIGREERENGIRSSVIYPGEVETPILDKRPVPVSAERRAKILQPEDVAAAVRFLVDLHPRAHVPELIIKPTVDDFI